MVEAGFFEPQRISPARLAIIIGAHAVLIAAVAAARMEVPLIMRPPTTTVVNIDPLKDPPPHPQTKSHPLPQHPVVDPDPPSHPDTSTKISDAVATWTDPGQTFTDPPPLDLKVGTGTISPPPTPVRIGAEFDPRYADRLQPPYPDSQLREGMEGFVRIKVIIGPDGRVKAAEEVFATNEDFFRAAQRQALSQWRFRPATVDGKPVESSMVLALKFELHDQG